MILVSKIIAALRAFFIGTKGQEQHIVPLSTFVASEYLDRMEQANLEILEKKEPVDRVIILWWGLDGLRLNDDGSLEWISRKKPEPVNQSAFCSPAQGIAQESYLLNYQNMCQSPQDTINVLQLQAQNMAITMALQRYTLYPQYLYGGTMYSPQLTDCCCNQLLR